MTPANNEYDSGSLKRSKHHLYALLAEAEKLNTELLLAGGV